MDWTGVKLPENPPPGYSAELWNSYRLHIKDNKSPPYSTEFKYEIQEHYRLPGLEKLENLNDETHQRLMDLLLISIPAWGSRWKDWKTTTIKKITGKSDQFSLTSPLAFTLTHTPWLQGSEDDRTFQFRPSDRWYIPSAALSGGGLYQFSHLMPMPVSIAGTVSNIPGLVDALVDLGMPSYDPDQETTEPRLLNDLASAWADPTIDISIQSVFLGQIRSAWEQFNPDEDGPFPDSVVVRTGTGSLQTLTPSDEAVVYLPDASSVIHNGLQLHSKPVIAMDPKDAKRLQGLFQKAYGEGVRLASELTTKALVDGEEWQEQDNANLLSGELEWLPSVVLSVFAFYGQSRGVGMKTFTNALDALRKSRIRWVDSLEAGLWHGDTAVARTSIHTLWLPKVNTLLAVNDARTEFNLLSEGLASIVDRADINVPLKLVLSDYEKVDEITDEIICLSLNKLHISHDQYHEVQQRWLGDLAWNIRLVRPLILLIQPHEDISPLDDVSTLEQFKEILQSYDLSPLDIDDVLSIIREATEFRSVGYQVWERLGDQAELSEWNEALSQAGESLVTNDQANEQFQAHFDSVRTMLRAIIRRAMRDNPALGGFAKLDAQLSETDCPSDYAEKFWIINFHDVMKVIPNVLTEWGVAPNVVSVVESARTAEELRDKLIALGLVPDIDPVSIHADNRKLFLRLLDNVQKVAIAWCLKENVDEGVWGQDYTVFETQLAEVFANTAFVDIWDEAMCFKVLRSINQSQTHEGLWEAINTVLSVSDLMDVLNISEAELITANGQLEQRKQKREIQKKTVNVCGADFVNTEDNLSNLWDHIISAIGDDIVSEADLGELEELQEQGKSKKRKRREKKPTTKKKPKQRMNQSMKDLIGLAGEIHAFRALQKVYGTNTVGPHSWISDNSRHKYPENSTNEGFGCDFVIHKDEKIYYVEVKATQTEDEAFELGSTEVELAIDSANRRKNRRKKEFLILHVLDALSENPQFRLLPNPYDTKHKNKYKFEEAGLRVRYEIVS